jgi:hypothetical protein
MDGAQIFPATDADQPRESGNEATGSDSLTAAEIKSWVREILDWIVKLLPVIATVLVAVVADHYKVSLTASTLLNEREKADSQLRSEMFAKLVDPISGARSGADVSLEREQLLAELLSLNFHEHIGLKPLLSHVDTRLARESVDIDEAKADAARSARQSFRSVARTVTSRQTAMLIRSSGESSKDGSAQIQKLDIGMPINDRAISDKLKLEKAQVESFGEPIIIENPMGTHRLYLTVSRPNWDSEIFHVDVSIYAVRPGGEVELANRDFELSWFDFPLTDNTLLGDGTRFAIVLDQIYDTNGRFSDHKPEQTTSDATRRVKLSIVWFPKDYIAARERPTNYREFRRSLGLDER